MLATACGFKELTPSSAASTQRIACPSAPRGVRAHRRVPNSISTRWPAYPPSASAGRPGRETHAKQPQARTVGAVGSGGEGQREQVRRIHLRCGAGPSALQELQVLVKLRASMSSSSFNSRDSATSGDSPTSTCHAHPAACSCQAPANREQQHRLHTLLPGANMLPSRLGTPTCRRGSCPRAAPPAGSAPARPSARRPRRAP